jgi:LysR family hca operon transcriptional activator
MEIESLREFVVLSRTLNFTKAAEMMHVTQPTLSKHITAMERELGCSLLERDRRHVELTESGQAFEAAAVQIIDVFDDVQTKISEIQKHDPIRVNGILNDSAIASIIGISATFLDDDGYPPVAYGSSMDLKNNMIEQVLNGDLDIAITSGDREKLEAMGLMLMPLTRSHFVAMVSSDCSLAQLQSVTLDELRNFRFVKFADSYAIDGWASIERVCRSHGFMPRTRTVVGRSRVSYTATPLGIEDVVILQSNMPQLRYMSEISDVKVIPVTDDDAMFRLYAIYKSDNVDRVKHVLDAYSRARKVIINHGKNNMLVEKD